MTSIKTTQALIIDPVEHGELIESALTGVLKPYPSGYYLPGQSKPVLESGKFYYTRVNGQDSPLQGIESVSSAIYTQDGELAVAAKLVKALTLEPTRPYRGIALVSLMVDHVLDSRAKWRKYTPGGREHRSLTDAVMDYLIGEIAIPLPQLTLIELAEQVAELTLELRTEVSEFVGEDHWVMHFQRQWRSNLVIEKSVDYRIHAWEQEHLKT